MKEIKGTRAKVALNDVYLHITWSKIAKEYFGKSSSWIYNKFNGRDGNGGDGDFTNEELALLKDAMLDFSERIKRAAETI